MKRTTLILLITLTSLTSTFASVGEGVSEVGTLSSINTVETALVIPVARFLYEEEVDALVWGTRFLGVASLATATQQGLQFFLEEIFITLLSEAGSLVGEIPNEIKDTKPEYISICFRYTENTGKIDNSNVLFLFEYENGDQLEVGIPSNVSYKYDYLATEENQEEAPKFASLISANKTTPSYNNYDFMSVYNAGMNMGPVLPFFEKDFTFYTIGVVTGYVEYKNKNYMIMQQYKETDLFWIEGMDLEFVAVDMSIENNYPEIGSVVRVGGTTEGLNGIISQEQDYITKEMNIQALIPDFVNMLNGNYNNDLMYNTSLLYVYGAMDYELVGIQWPGTDQKPDFKVEFPFALWITPTGHITRNSTYTLHASVLNQGNVDGSAVVEFYYYSMEPEYLIGKTSVEDAQPLQEKLISVEWNTANLEIKPQTPLLIYAVVKNSAPMEENTVNNLDYVEHYFSDYSDGSYVSAHCPIKLEVTTNDGGIVNVEENTIADSKYELFDYNNDGELDHRIYLPPNLTQNDIKINVIPLDYAQNEDLVTVTVYDNNQITTLADSITIADLPDEPYDFTVTDVEDKENVIPTEYSLAQNYPNPFNPSTVINYSIPPSSVILSGAKNLNTHVSLKVYDVLGHEVATLVNKQQSSGNYQVTFDASNLSSGVYYYKLKAGEFLSTKKMLLLK